MSKRNSSHRILAVAGLLGLAATVFSAQDASAFGHGGFGHGGGFGGGFGGGLHINAGGGRGFGGGGFGGHGFGGGHFGGHTPGLGRLPGLGRFPGRLPPIVRLPPHRFPPIFRPPYHVPPVIVRFPPRFPPPVIVRGPPRILPPPVIIGQAPPPVIVGGRSVAMAQYVRPAAAVQEPVQAPVSCGVDGSFVSVVFVPTVTAADITAFLKAYNVTMADGPNADGIYRIRLSTTVMPSNEVLKVIDSMRTQTAIVSNVDGA